jgi:hypothetical protein
VRLHEEVEVLDPRCDRIAMEVVDGQVRDARRVRLAEQVAQVRALAGPSVLVVVRSWVFFRKSGWCSSKQTGVCIPHTNLTTSNQGCSATPEQSIFAVAAGQ